MKLIGQDCGPTRLPLVGLSESDTQKMADQLREIGFFDWAV